MVSYRLCLTSLGLFAIMGYCLLNVASSFKRELATSLLLKKARFSVQGRHGQYLAREKVFQIHTARSLASRAMTSDDNDDEKLLQKVQDTLAGSCGLQFNGNECLILCVSGGSDSIALAELINRINKKTKIMDGRSAFSLEVLHFNHKLRGKESDNEAIFVEKFCSQREMSFNLREWTENEELNRKASKTIGIQARSRKWRRQEALHVLQAIAHQKSLPSQDIRIVTAHHSEDQEETVILQLLRGAHLSGLQGMKSTSFGQYIKPLLNVSKQDLVSFLERNGIEWREDSSNKLRKYKRNQVRLDILPQLRDLAGGSAAFRLRIEELAHQSQLLEEHLNIEVTRWNEQYRDSVPSQLLPLSNFNIVSPLLQNEILYQFITRQTGSELSFQQLQRIYDMVNSENNIWSIDLGSNWILQQKGEMLMLLLAGDSHPGSLLDDSKPKTHCVGETTIFSYVDQHWALEENSSGWVKDPRSSAFYNSPSARNNKDFPKIHSVVCFNIQNQQKLEIRFRKAGDKFQAPWLPKDQKLKDFLRGQKVQLHERDLLPLLCLGDEVIAVIPLGIVSSSYHKDMTGFPAIRITMAKR